MTINFDEIKNQKEFTTSLEINGDNFFVHYNRGNNLYENGNYEGAIVEYK